MKKNVLITGCAQGLGKFLVEAFSKDHYSVIGVDRLKPSEVQPDLNSLLHRYYEFDLLETTRITTFVEKVIQDNNVIDVLINNAGIKYFKPFVDADEKDILHVFSVNAVAPILLIKGFLPHFLSRRSGKIVNISSNAAMRGYRNGSLYCSSKSALLRFSEAIAEELSGSGVSVLTLCPATISTREYKDKHPNASLKRLISPNEIYSIIEKEIHKDRNSFKHVIKFKEKMSYLKIDILRNIKLLGGWRQ